MDDPVTWSLLTTIGGVSGTTAFLTWFVASQFSKTRRLFYRALSLHNKEDDDRFEALSQDIWRLHMRNARRDGDEPPRRQIFPRRRYLDEEINGN